MNYKVKDKDLDKFCGITLLDEENYSTGRIDVEYWDGEIKNFPLKPGTTFPNNQHKFRSNINKTMQALIQGELKDALEEYVTNFPTLDPLTNKKISTIIANLYTFQLVLRTWRQLIKPIYKGVKVNGEDRPDLFEKIPFNESIAGKFTNCDNLYLAYKSGNESKVRVLSDKNIYLVRNKADNLIPSITNVYNNIDGETRLEVVTLYDDVTYRQEYEYNNGKVGNKLSVQTLDSNNYMIYIQNGENTAEVSFGRPEMSNCITPTIALIRAFNTLCMLIEKKREVLRVVPDSAITKDVITGAAVYQTGGTLPYSTQNPETIKDNHTVEFKTPDLKLEELLKSFDVLLDQLSLYSGLSPLLLGTKSVSGNLSGRALLTSCAPTLILLKGYTNDFNNLFKNIIAMLCKLDNKEVELKDIELDVDTPDAVLYNIVNGLSSISEDKQPKQLNNNTEDNIE